MARMYIYGSKITDTVRVVPSDNGVRFHSGYDKTAGKIPNEDDPMYEFFAMDPYGYNSIEEEKRQAAPYSIQGNSILMKLPSDGRGNADRGCVTAYPGMPPLECIRYTKEHVLRNANKRYPYPNKRGTIIYGQSNAELSKNVECECINGKYQIKDISKPIGEYIQVMKSGWRYNRVKKDWEEYCWERGDMQNTYYHETNHIEFSRRMMNGLYTSYFKETIFDTEKECMKKAKKQLSLLKLAWGNWYQTEQAHDTEEWKEEVKRNPFGQYRQEAPQCPN
jgi:hypothetical protein